MDYPRNYNYIKLNPNNFKIPQFRKRQYHNPTTENMSIKSTCLNHIDPKIINPLEISIISIKLIRKQ